MQNKITIPLQLQKEGFGFVKLRPKTKAPHEIEWQNNPYNLEQITKWVEQGNNYGVLGGYGGLIIIDADSVVIKKLIEAKLPLTFTVKSRADKRHYYYFCPEIKSKIVLDDNVEPSRFLEDEDHYGEIISFGSQVVGAGSIHPETYMSYEVINNIEIVSVSKEQIFSVLAEFLPHHVFAKKDSNIEDDNDLNILDVLKTFGIATEYTGRQLQISHPIHGSTNNNNFVANPEKNVWHCFRHGSGGGVMGLIAVLEGVIDCSKAIPGGLRGEDFIKTKIIACEKYGLRSEPKEQKSKNEIQQKIEQFISSKILPDGRIIEMIYKEEYEETQLAIFDGQKVKYENKLNLSNEILLPYAASNRLISEKVILFASEAEEYGTTKGLLVRIQTFIHQYLDISPLFEKIAAYYVLSTWVYDRFGELAYLRALGEYGSGKSRLLQVIGSICYKPMFVGGATTTSPIFRIIDAFRGTLILDEADYRFSDTTAEIIKILNTGYQKGVPVLRSEGKGTYEVKSYNVFCPKILATRKRFQDQALESRCLVEEMDKKELRSDIPFNLPEAFCSETLALRNQLLMWRFKNVNRISLRPADIDRSLEPRLNQIIMPLLSIIEDEEARKELKNFIKEYNNELVVDRGMSMESEVFEALLKCFDADYSEPTVKQVAEIYYDAEIPSTEKNKIYRKIGHILRRQLKLRATRTREGYIIPKKDNTEKIKTLRVKYGIASEVSPVNDVNVVNVVGEQEKEVSDNEIDMDSLI